MKYAVIGSGSCANSYIFEYNKTAYVFDNGFSLREFKKRIDILGFSYSNIKGIFLTHIHSDHLKGVSSLSRDLEIPVYAHKNICGDFYIKKDILPNNHYVLDNIDVMPFELSHDAPNSIGFYFKIGGKIITIITDTGKITTVMEKLAPRSNLLFLEANYNIEMLRNGSYPPYLKKRIASSKGHLSNNESIGFLNKISENINSKVEMVYFCHLSKNSNSVEALSRDIQTHYTGKIPFKICKRGESVTPEALLLAELTT